MNDGEHANILAEEKKKKKGSTASALCHFFGTIILIAVIASLAAISVPQLMGYEVYDVLSGSMEPEIPAGSAAYVKTVDPVTLEEGDVAAFISDGSMVMHRVVSNHMVEGYLITKGDANEREDIDEVPYEKVHGLVVKHVPMLGQLMMILSGTVGKILMLCLALCGVLLNILAGRLR